MASNSYQCKYCPYLADSLSKRLDHSKYVHSNQPGFEIICQIDNCPKKYTCVRSLHKHIKRKHTAAAQSLVKRNVSCKGLDVLQVPHNAEGHDFETMSDQDENQDEILHGATSAPVQHDYQEQHATFLLTLKEFNRVPQNACNKISDQMQNVLELNNEQFGDRVNKVLQEKGCVTAEDISIIVAQQNAQSAEACERLNSGYKLDKYAKSIFSTVEPEDIILGIGPDNKPRTMQYVPVKKSLQQLLNHEDVLSQVFSGHTRKSTDGKLRDFRDGTVFKENALFKLFPNALQIQLYNDEFCVANPLGYRQRKYKINAIYYILGNLDPKYRSRLDMIQLVCLAKNIHVKQYGILSLLEPIIDDIKDLETKGIIITFEDRDHLLYGTVSFLSTDNLAAHFIARMRENFSTVLRLCRTCNVTKYNLPITTRESQCTLRTPASYNAQAEMVQAQPHLVGLYGVKEKSPMNNLKFYHVIDGLPPCLAHDLFEGVGPEIFEPIVKNLIALGFFTLEEFWSRVENFPYNGPDLANKPSVVQVEKVKLKFTQSQTWCFLRLFPLIVGDRVPQDNPLWKLAVLFLEVLDQVLAPVISQRDLNYMQQVVEDFLIEVKTTLPKTKLKPKFHYMLHYATATKKFGPLIRCWTMRFEAEHNEHKQVAARTKNKRHICKTMAKRKQSRQALIHSKENILDGAQYSDCIGVISFPVQLLHKEIQSLLEPYLNGEFQAEMATSVTITGTKYSQGSAVVLGEQYDSYEFGKIENIFIISGIPYLCCQKMEVCEFSAHYHSYSVQESNRFILVQAKDLLDYHPLGLYQVHGKMYITLRYKLSCI